MSDLDNVEIWRVSQALGLPYSAHHPRRGLYLRYCLQGREALYPDIAVVLYPLSRGWLVGLGPHLEIALSEHRLCCGGPLRADGDLAALAVLRPVEARDLAAALAVLRPVEARSDGLLSRLIEDHGRERITNCAGAVAHLVRLLRDAALAPGEGR